MKLLFNRSLSFLSFTLLAFTSAQTAIASPKITPLLRPVQIKPGAVKPNPVVLINRKAAKKALLPDAEVKAIQALQSAISPALVSPVSPDETTIVIQLKQSGERSFLSFLNVQDGSQLKINGDQFRGYVPVLGWQWRDRNTVVAIAQKQSHKPNQLEYVLLLVNRSNGKVKLKSLDFLQSLGMPVSLSPDGRRLLVILNSQHESKEAEKEDSQEDGESKPTAYSIVNVSNGEVIHRFVLPAEVALSNPAWTSDGSQIAFVRGWSPTSLNQLKGESLSDPVTQEAMGLLAPKENPYLQQNVLQVINLQTGKQRLVSAADGNGSIFSSLAWSLDNKKLLVQMNEPVKLEGRINPTYIWNEHRTFRVYDAALQETSHFDVPELSQSEDEGITNFEFISPQEVVFNALNGMDVQLYSYNIQTAELRKFSTQAGSYGTSGIAVIPGTRQAIASYSSYTAPPELYRIALNTGQATPLTALNRDIAEFNQTRSDPISFTLANGERLTGVLLQPASAPFPPADMPLVVWQEGGPMSSMTSAWSADVERPFALLPNFGFAVLVVPLYGRYGFGTERFNTLYNGFNSGQVDIDAMAEIVQQAIAQGYATAGNVGITGCSYGGYFTAQSIVRHPRLYAAANAQCSLIDTDADWKIRGGGYAAFDFGSPTPFSNVDRFHQTSPIYNANQVKTPLLIFHGSRDFLPVYFVENFYWLVASQGTPTRMIKFIGAEHGLDAAEYQVYAAQEMIQWFRTYLKP